jgi:hypothetical protein
LQRCAISCSSSHPLALAISLSLSLSLSLSFSLFISLSLSLSLSLSFFAQPSSNQSVLKAGSVCFKFRNGLDQLYTVFIQYFGRTSTIYTVIYGVHIQFWPILMYMTRGNSFAASQKYKHASYLPFLLATFLSCTYFEQFTSTLVSSPYKSNCFCPCSRQCRLTWCSIGFYIQQCRLTWCIVVQHIAQSTLPPSFP